MSAAEIDRTLQRLAHRNREKSGGTKHLALIASCGARAAGAAHRASHAAGSTA